jgi:hypothetical protein
VGVCGCAASRGGRFRLRRKPRWRLRCAESRGGYKFSEAKPKGVRLALNG